MATPTLPWPNLESYKLIAQMAQDSKGKSVLMLRPFDSAEDPEVSARRAQLMKERLESVANQVGQGRLGTRLMRGQINILVGPMVNTPAKMSAFLQKLFPRATVMNLTADQIRQHDFIRAEAQRISKASEITADSPFNLDALNEALPGDLVFQIYRDQMELVSRLDHDTPIYRSRFVADLSNGQAKGIVSDALNVAWEHQKTDKIGQIHQRQLFLDGQAKALDNDFWKSAVIEIEQELLNGWEIEAKTRNAELIEERPWGLNDLIALRETLKARLEAQGQVVDDRLLKKVTDVERQIDEIRMAKGDAADSGGADVVRDNVQENDGFESAESDLTEGDVSEAIGVNFDGEDLYEDATGVRFKLQRGVRVNEKAAQASGGAQKADRDVDWMTMDEAIEAPYSGLPLSLRIRGQFFQMDSELANHEWRGMTIRHEDQDQQVLIRQPQDDSETLQLLTLNAYALKQGDEATINAHMLRVMGDNRLLNEGMPKVASDQTLKIWASHGMSLPENAPQAARERFEAVTVTPNDSEQETADERPRETSGDEGTDHPDNGRGEGLPADTDRVSGGVSAGGRSGGVPSGDGDVAGGHRDAVSDAVADGDQPGQPAGSVNDQERERGNPESSDGAAGDQQGPEAHAEVAVRGPGSGRGNGTDGQPGTGPTGADRGRSEHAGVGAADGDGAGVPGRTDGSPEDALAEKPADDRGAGGSSGSPAGVSDEADGEPAQSEATGDGAVPGAGGTAGSADGQPADDDQAPTDSPAATESAADTGGGTDSDADADGIGGGAPAGRVDWEQFADEQSAAGDEGPEPLRGDPELESRSAPQRVKDNIAAIRLLADLEKDNAEPTMEDRQILAKFSGFGGIHAQMFRTYGRAPQWVLDASMELAEMANQSKLTRTELESMRSTVLNAHYTHSGLIGPMWEALNRMGLPMERVLEPSCGIGNFKSFMPEAVAAKIKSFTGIEKDAFTARLAQKVHPDAKIISSGFERTTFPDSFFDTVVSNIPFGDFQMFDREHPERKCSIHNAFFLKGLDKVREGGVVAFVTSSYVLDGKDSSIRSEIMDRAHVMGTYRMPAGTFKDTTGTEVVTDIIFLQKKGNFTPNYEPLNILGTKTVSATVHASSLYGEDEEFKAGEEMGGFRINEVYVEHPERVLGELAAVSNQFGPTLTVLGGGTVEEQRQRATEAFASLPEKVTDSERTSITAADINDMLANRSEEATDLADLPGALSVQNGEIYVKSIGADGSTVAEKNTKFPKNMQRRAQAAITAMVALSELLDAETSGNVDDTTLDAQRAVTRDLFDEWEQLEMKSKPAFSKKAWGEILKDPRAQRMVFKEIYDGETRELRRPDILNGRTVRPMNEQPTRAKDLTDALAISLAYTGIISESYIVSLLQEDQPEITVSDVREQLVEQGLAFVDPVNQKMVERAVYLSGNLAPKIKACQAVVEAAPEFQVNLDALEESLPAPLSASQIKVAPDAFWLPEDVINEFLRDGLGITTSGNHGVKAYFDDVKRHWRLEPSAISGKPSMGTLARAQEHVTKSRWGTERRHAFELLDNLFTNTIPKVQDPIPHTEPTQYKINPEETLKAQAKHDEIKDAFDRWIYKSPERAQRLVDLYNENFNTTVLYEPDGSHLVFPGMAESWVPRKHQADFIWRGVSSKNSMTAHVVGAGKTLQLIGTAIRGKQMGRWNKPLVVVPNHMLEQFANDGQDIYPNAKILVMSAADARAANRAGFAAKCAMGDWDMVVCTHSVFEKITVPHEFEAQIIESEVVKLRAALEDSDKRKTPKEVEKAIARLEARLERTMDEINKGNENVLNMEQIGIDFVGVDEAHYYKNLMPDTASSIPGVTNASSKRATNMLIKSQYLRQLHGDCYGLMMATGTPISNSIVECYTFTRMLRPDILEECGIFNFNDWMGLFGEIRHGMEMKPEGGGYQMKSRLSRFKNIPELVKMIRTFIDFKTREDLNLPSPEIITEQVASDPSNFMKDFMKYIEARAKGVRNRSEGPGSKAEMIATAIREGLYRANDKTALEGSNDEVDPDAIDSPKDDILLTIATDGRKASLDPRLIHPKFEDNPDSKLNKCVRNLVSIYRKFDEQKALQMVFCDFSSPMGKGIFNVYDDIKAKLIKAGIPEEEIAFIHSAKTDADKEDMFAKCRSGEIRFLLGSTQKMGVGTNVQERLVALHELDPPWKPADIEQRLGRMDRQGNSFDTAFSYRYVTVDSFDLFMWETLNRKLKMVNQAMRRPEDCAREIDEEIEPGYEDILSITTGNPAIREFMDTRQQMDKLKRMLDSHIDQQADIGGQILDTEKKIERIKEYLDMKIQERDLVQQNTPMALWLDNAVPKLADGPMMVVGGLQNLADALEQLVAQCPRYRTSDIGTFGGLPVQVNRMGTGAAIMLKRFDGTEEALYKVSDSQDLYGNDIDDDPVDHFYEAAKTLVRYVRKIGNDNGIRGTEDALESAKRNLASLHDDHGKPFPYEEDMKRTKARFEELASEVGDELDDSSHQDPFPLARMGDEIHKRTGAHAGLKKYIRGIVDDSGAVVSVDDDHLDLLDEETYADDDDDLNQTVA